MINDDLDLIQLARSGELLACVDDTSYRLARVVFAWPSDGMPDVYCAEADWPTTPAAKLAAKDREIAELAATLETWAAEVTEQTRRAVAAEARIRELEAQLVAPPPETPKRNQERMFSAQAQALTSDAAPEIDPCPDCGQGGWKSARALQMHRQRTHQGMQTTKAQGAQFVEDLGWRCAAKGCPGAHARSMHDPAFCTLHAARQITNGEEVAHG